MELRKSFDIRKIFFVVSFLVFVILLTLGLTPAEASAQYEVSGVLSIPSIQLTSDVTKLELKDRKLDTPAVIVGSFSNHKNKTLLIGHSSTVFTNLHEITIGNTIIYNGTNYLVIDAEVVEKDNIDMADLLKAEKVDTLVLMTCAGEDYGNGDSSHRIILTAIVL